MDTRLYRELVVNNVEGGGGISYCYDPHHVPGWVGDFKAFRSGRWVLRFLRFPSKSFWQGDRNFYQIFYANVTCVSHLWPPWGSILYSAKWILTLRVVITLDSEVNQSRQREMSDELTLSQIHLVWKREWTNGKSLFLFVSLSHDIGVCYPSDTFSESIFWTLCPPFRCHRYASLYWSIFT